MGKNNTSGVVGVYYNRFNETWVAMWNKEGRDKYTQVLFRYGFETAKELAIEFRARKERELPHYANVL